MSHENPRKKTDMKPMSERPLHIFGGLIQNLIRFFGFVQDLFKSNRLLQSIFNKIHKPNATAIAVCSEFGMKVRVNWDIRFLHGQPQYSVFLFFFIG